MEREHQDYEDLTAKYDLLEEDYVVIKTKLVQDKETIEKYASYLNKLCPIEFTINSTIINYLLTCREYLSLKKEHDTVLGELRALRETFNLRQDTWIKEKLDMQVR